MLCSTTNFPLADAWVTCAPVRQQPLERSPRTPDNLNDRPILEHRFRRRGLPHGSRLINSDIIPHNRYTVMLTHHVREQPLF
jgi:hypothetical protein